jgi:hypothetical protein
MVTRTQQDRAKIVAGVVVIGAILVAACVVFLTAA